MIKAFKKKLMKEIKEKKNELLNKNNGKMTIKK